MCVYARACKHGCGCSAHCTRIPSKEWLPSEVCSSMFSGHSPSRTRTCSSSDADSACTRAAVVSAPASSARCCCMTCTCPSAQYQVSCINCLRQHITDSRMPICTYRPHLLLTHHPPAHTRKPPSPPPPAPPRPCAAVPPARSVHRSGTPGLVWCCSRYQPRLQPVCSSSLITILDLSPCVSSTIHRHRHHHRHHHHRHHAPARRAAAAAGPPPRSAGP